MPVSDAQKRATAKFEQEAYDKINNQNTWTGDNMINNDVVVNIGDLKIYDNDFELTIDEACQKFKIDDLVKEGQSRWKAVMFYVGTRGQEMPSIYP